MSHVLEDLSPCFISDDPPSPDRLSDAQKVEQRTQKMKDGQIGVLLAESAELRYLRDIFIRATEKYEEPLAGHNKDKRLAKTYNETKIVFDKREYDECIKMIIPARKRYEDRDTLKPGRSGEPQFSAVLYWKYAMMRALLLPWDMVAKSLRDARKAVMSALTIEAVLEDVYRPNIVPAEMMEENVQYIDAVMRQEALGSKVSLEKRGFCTSASIIGVIIEFRQEEDEDKKR